MGALAISERDRAIVTGALRRLEGAQFRFDDAVRALRDATEATIAAGRVFHLATTDDAPILAWQLAEATNDVSTNAFIPLLGVYECGLVPFSLGKREMLLFAFEPG